MDAISLRFFEAMIAEYQGEIIVGSCPDEFTASIQTIKINTLQELYERVHKLRIKYEALDLPLSVNPQSQAPSDSR